MNCQDFRESVDVVVGGNVTNLYVTIEPSDCAQCRSATIARRHRVVVKRRLHRFSALLAVLALVTGTVGYFAGRPVEPFAFAVSILLAAMAVRTLGEAAK